MDFYDTQLIESAYKYNDCFELLTLCNDVIVDRDVSGAISYSSSSPDEIAIVNFAKLCGYELIGEQNDMVGVYNRKEDRIYRYRLLATLDFTSDRKRMSVLVENEKKEIKLYTKGADNLVGRLLKPGSPYAKITEKSIDEFSVEGLRTLMLAYRSVPLTEYQQWRRVYDQAVTNITDREAMLARSYELIEKDLQLIGCTAVEDKLQEHVPHTIQLLKECEIVFYMLTGDKR